MVLSFFGGLLFGSGVQVLFSSRPLYQLPSYEKQNYLFGSNTIIANQIGKAIDELKEITGEGFDKFRVGVEHGGYGGKTENQISVLELRTKLNGLIMRLYGA